MQALAILAYTALSPVSQPDLSLHFILAMEKVESKDYHKQRWCAGQRPDLEFLNKEERVDLLPAPFQIIFSHFLCGKTMLNKKVFGIFTYLNMT